MHVLKINRDIEKRQKCGLISDLAVAARAYKLYLFLGKMYIKKSFSDTCF